MEQTYRITGSGTRDSFLARAVTAILSREADFEEAIKQKSIGIYLCEDIGTIVKVGGESGNPVRICIYGGDREVVNITA